jgi:5-methylcytosine-specific restriction endonuclease McrA
MNKVLVLNKSWRPIAVIDIKRAIGLIFGCYNDGSSKALILDVNNNFMLYTWADWSLLKAGAGEAVIHGVKQNFRIPEIIVLSRYNRMPQKRVHFSRRTIYRRDNNQCNYCGARPGTSELSIDHIMPRSRGGLTTWENCCLACTKCNRKKGNKTPEEAGMALIRKPFKPKHILYQGDYRCKSWEELLGVSYWSIELENDM